MNKQEIISEILIPLEKAGYQAYFVGGCVRDTLMNKPVNDYDVVTDATPDKIKNIFNHFPLVDINSEAFGIVVVNLNGDNIEIATFRKDRECDGRHTEVTYTSSMEEDASRRDFTINALYEDSKGNIYDPLNEGLKDIEEGNLRFIGDAQERLKEDNLRLLRFFRFAATKSSKEGKQLTHYLPSSCVSYILSDIFVDSFNIRVSGERIGKEMKKLISGKYAAEVIPEMMALCFRLEKVFPVELYKLKDQLCYNAYHTSANNFTHTIKVFKSVSNDINDFILRTAALFHDLGKVETQTDDFHALKHEIFSSKITRKFLSENWKITKAEISQICHLIEKHMEMHSLNKSKHATKVWRFVRENDFERLLILLKGDCADSPFKETDYIKLTTYKNMDFFRSQPYPEYFTGEHLSKYVDPGKYFSRGLEVANDDVARAILKSVDGKFSINEESILKHAAQTVKEFRKVGG